MDETNDPTPHPHVSAEPHVADTMGKHGRKELSIWFFCGILTLGYGLVLAIQGMLEYHNPPANELLLQWIIPLHPTLWWGVALTVFGLFYTVRFRPGKG